MLHRGHGLAARVWVTFSVAPMPQSGPITVSVSHRPSLDCFRAGWREDCVLRDFDRFRQGPLKVDGTFA
jgi:hypothetical protein